MTVKRKGDIAGDKPPRYGDDVTVRLVVDTSQCLIVGSGLVPDLGRRGMPTLHHPLFDKGCAGDKPPRFFCKRIAPVDASTMVVLRTLLLLAVGTAISPSQWAYVWIASSLKLLAMTVKRKGDIAGDKPPRYGMTNRGRFLAMTNSCSQ